MLPDLIQEKMNKQKLSLRAASQKIGIAHSTLMRILEGYPCRQDSLQKIAKWLDIPPANLIDTFGFGTDRLAAEIASALRQEPKLAYAFGEAARSIAKGEVSHQILREIAAFAAFRLDYSRQDAVQHEPVNE